MSKYGHRPHNWFEAIVNKLGGEEGAECFLRGELTVSAIAAPAFVHDKTKDGWELLQNVPRRITSVRDLEILPFLKAGESSINGEEMARRAVELDANLGQWDAEYLFKHQDEIPAELRRYYLVFPGTVWRDPDGDHGVPYLGWDGLRWCLGFDGLDDDWGSFGRLLRPCK